MASALAVPRWIVTGASSSGLVLIICQASHGITFGLFWIAAVTLVAQHAPKNAEASAQGLLSAAVGGFGAGIGSLASAWIVEQSSTQMMFWTAAVVSLLATLMALKLQNPAQAQHAESL